MKHDDQALAFHHIGHRFYELSGLRTGNVRDQILRATLVVQRLAHFGVISRNLPLFVAGGGAAGVSAALTACKLGINVVIVERYHIPFATQMRAKSRFLDPTEYDWPHVHWDKGTMAWKGTPYPLLYQADSAYNLAQQWSSVFDAVLNRTVRLPAHYGILEFIPRVDIREEMRNGSLFFDWKDDDAVYVGPWPAYGARGRRFGAALSCIGFSGEDTSVPAAGGQEYQGPPFWQNDTLDLPRAGIRPVGKLGQGQRVAAVNVLISGGGDGAQQDFLRVATGSFGKRLFHKFQPHLPDNFMALALADDVGRRAHVWARDGHAPSGELRTWHAAYEAFVDDIWNGWSHTEKYGFASKLLRQDVRATWLMGGEVPPYCYGLNRLLALLVARLCTFRTNRRLHADSATDFAGDPVVVRNHKLDRVAPVDPGHVCQPKRRFQCYGVHHLAHLRPSGSTTPSATVTLGPFDLIMVRHGVKQEPLFGSAPIWDQVVAFDLPK